MEHKLVTTKKVFILFLAFAILFSLVIVTAQSTDDVRPNVGTITIFFNNLLHSSGTFSVVGDSKSCGTSGGNADDSWSVASGGSLLSGHSISSNALVDIFVNGWTPLVEGPASAFSGWTCGATSAPCNVQVYNCPTQSCSSPTTVSCSAWSGTSYYRCPTESNMPYYTNSFSYCAQVSTMTCYYKDGSSCSSRTYDKNLFPNACESYIYQNQNLFSTQAACTASICTPQQCDSSVCSGVTCSDGCGGYSSGTKTDGACVSNPGGNAGTCTASQVSINGVCQDKSIICVVDGGTKTDGDCASVITNPNDEVLADKITILNLKYLNADGSAITGNLVPGQQVRVTFTVRSTEWRTGKDYLVEAGAIPFSTAVNWDMAKPSGYFSLFDLFATQESNNDACCGGQLNFADNSQTLGTTIWEELGNGVALRNFDYIIRIPDPSTTDLCGSQKYWDENSSKFIIYAIVKNGCQKDGYVHNVFVSQVVNLDLNATTSQQGIPCDYDGQCATGEKCLDAPGFLTGKTCQGTATGNLSLVDLKKVSLTKEEISTYTSTELLGSACYTSNECLPPNENMTASCISLSKLKADGTLTDVTTSSFFDNANKVIVGSAIGAGAGLTTCLLASAGVLGATLGTGILISAAVAGTCAAAGGLLGGAITDLVIQIKPTDPIVKALKARDASSVGICTATPASTGINGFLASVGNFWNFTGDSVTSGIIILIGGFFILMILLGALSKK